MNTNANERGFSYVDLMVGVLILLVGVMALAAALTIAVVRTRESERQLIAKQLASSSLENIFSARDIGPLGWNAVGNENTNFVNGVAQGRFLVGRQGIRVNPGADGVPGTNDDTPSPGPDGVVGTNDDVGPFLPGFQRQIVVTDYDDPERRTADGFPIMIRRIDVTIFYNVGNVLRQETASTMITNYAVQ